MLQKVCGGGLYHRLVVVCVFCQLSRLHQRRCLLHGMWCDYRGWYSLCQATAGTPMLINVAAEGYPILMLHL